MFLFFSSFRNKEEAYFVASDVLKKICKIHKGVEAVRKLPALVKRLHALVEELTRKANMEKRLVFFLSCFNVCIWLNV